MKTVEDLKKRRDEMKHLMYIREADGFNKIVVSMGTYGITHGARDVMAKILDVLANLNLNNVMVTQSGMIGEATEQVVVEIHHNNSSKVFKNVKVEDVEEIITSSIQN